MTNTLSEIINDKGIEDGLKHFEKEKDITLLKKMK